MIENKTNRLPVGAIMPKGWLLDQLKLQADGITGILDEHWDSVGSYSAWLGGTGENWERGPYYLDGLLPLAYLLEDKALIQKANRWVEWSLNSQTEDGNFGPKNNSDWWPRYVMIKVLTQFQELTGDTRVIPFLTKYFQYMNERIEAYPVFSWGWVRVGDLLVSIKWLYERTNDAYLLDLWDTLSKQMYDWSDNFSRFPFTRPTAFYYNWKALTQSISSTALYESIKHHPTHIVNNAMGIKTPMLEYMKTGDPKHKQAFYDAIENLTKYHGTANGMFTGDENLAGNSPTQGSELCAVIEYMYSLQVAYDAVEDTKLGDLLERLAYNALPGTMTEDFKGHQYLQQSNQVLVSKAKRNWYNNNDESNLFGLEPNFGCCTANLHQGWPKFVQTLFRKTPSGVSAEVYAPCEMQFTGSSGNKIIIQETTNYPFEDTIVFTIYLANDGPKEEEFTLRLRIPSWCDESKIETLGGTINGTPGSYVDIRRTFTDNETVTLTLPMTVRTSHWYHNACTVEYGALIMSLNIGEKWTNLGGYKEFPTWGIEPTSPWNYCLALENGQVQVAAVTKNELGQQPFRKNDPPVILQVKAQKLPGWELENDSAGDLPVSPIQPPQTESEVITLVPYAGTKLRITEFPWCGL